MIGRAPICYDCKYFYYNKVGEKCMAFPDGIPDEIWFEKVKHTEPYPGDNGIRFKKISDKEFNKRYPE